jgi:hypothetical protein
MSNVDTQADFCAAAAPLPRPDDDADDGRTESGPSTTSAAFASSTTPHPAFPALTNFWRGLFTLSLGLTLCALAVAEATGDARAPTWFLGFAIPVLTEWIGQWVVRGRQLGTQQ